MLEVRLLGKFEVRHDKETINISSRPAQSLFAYLLLNAGTSHRREKLAGLLWPDSLEETARDNLRHALWRLRKALPSKPRIEYLLADDLSIAFNVAAEYWLDFEELEGLNEDCSADELIAVLSNYEGELLPGFYDEWVMLEREHLFSTFEHRMARLMSLLQDEHRWLDIVEWGERWIKMGQKPEPAYRALMSAHAAKGDLSKVVATYERCVKSLKEFGIEPSDQTRTLYERLKKGKEILELASTIPMKERRNESPKTNLPVPVTSFIGREKEVAQVVEFLGENRLVTLTGSGGVGKTRLAIESSKRLLDKFKDGVWWIDLVGLNDPSLVPQMVARVLGVNGMPNQTIAETLTENIRLKQLLLVLDNCEHLINACTQLAAQLLTGCENLKILATSREALDVLGEVAWRVPSLSLPDSQDDFSIKTLVESEGIRLFTERAEAKQTRFSLTYQNAQAIVQICRRLDGIPLAIELAAARVKMMSVDEIARRLDDRLNLLTVGNRAAPLRHQTLRAAIDWSHELLIKSEQILFRSLSVFAGGFTLDAAEEVCRSEKMNRNHVLPLLGRLVDKSLVFVEGTSRDGQTRYRLLETIREYALEKLIESGEEPIFRDHHMEFFTRLAVNAEPKLIGDDAMRWVNRLDADHDNLLAAIDWSLNSENPDFALRIVGALNWWDVWHNTEGAERSLQVVQSPLTNHPTLLRARALNTAGIMQWFQGNRAQALALLEEALAIAKEIADKENYVWTLIYLGSIVDADNDNTTAQTYLEEAIDAARKLEATGTAALGHALAFLGDVFILQGDRERARPRYEESITHLRKLNNINFIGYPIRRLAELTLDHAEYEKAITLCKESLALNAETGDQRAMVASLAACAAIAAARGQPIPAVRLYGAVEFLLKTISATLLPTDQQAYNRNVAILRSRLDETTFDLEWAEGSEMTMEEAIGFALAEFKQ